MDFARNKLQSIYTNIKFTDKKARSTLTECPLKDAACIHLTNSRGELISPAESSKYNTQANSLEFNSGHVSITHSLKKSSKSISLTLSEHLFARNSPSENHLFKIITDKLCRAYQYLSPIIDEIINNAKTFNSSSSEKVLESSTNCFKCYVSQEQYTGAIKASKLIQEVNNEVIRSAASYSNIVEEEILYFPVNEFIASTIDRTIMSISANSGKDTLKSCTNTKIYIEKSVINQLMELYNLLHGALQQLYKIAKQNQISLNTNRRIMVKNESEIYSSLNFEHSLGEVELLDYSKQLAKLQKEYRELSNTADILKSIIQETFESVSDVTWLKRRPNLQRRSRSDNSITESEKTKKVTDITGARKCILECLAELVHVRKYLKRVDNSVELQISPTELIDDNQEDCHIKGNDSCVHAKLNGIPIVIKLNRGTSHRTLSFAEVLRQRDKGIKILSESRQNYKNLTNFKSEGINRSTKETYLRKEKRIQLCQSKWLIRCSKSYIQVNSKNFSILTNTIKNLESFLNTHHFISKRTRNSETYQFPINKQILPTTKVHQSNVGEVLLNKSYPFNTRQAANKFTTTPISLKSSTFIKKPSKSPIRISEEIESLLHTSKTSKLRRMLEMNCCVTKYDDINTNPRASVDSLNSLFCDINCRTIKLLNQKVIEGQTKCNSKTDTNVKRKHVHIKSSVNRLGQKELKRSNTFTEYVQQTVARKLTTTSRLLNNKSITIINCYHKNSKKIAKPDNSAVRSSYLAKSFSDGSQSKQHNNTVNMSASIVIQTKSTVKHEHLRSKYHIITEDPAKLENVLSIESQHSTESHLNSTKLKLTESICTYSKNQTCELFSRVPEIVKFNIITDYNDGDKISLNNTEKFNKTKNKKHINMCSSTLKLMSGDASNVTINNRLSEQEIKCCNLDKITSNTEMRHSVQPFLTQTVKHNLNDKKEVKFDCNKKDRKSSRYCQRGYTFAEKPICYSKWNVDQLSNYRDNAKTKIHSNKNDDDYCYYPNVEYLSSWKNYPVRSASNIYEVRYFEIEKHNTDNSSFPANNTTRTDNPSRGPLQQPHYNYNANTVGRSSTNTLDYTEHTFPWRPRPFEVRVFEFGPDSDEVSDTDLPMAMSRRKSSNRASSQLGFNPDVARPSQETKSRYYNYPDTEVPGIARRRSTLERRGGEPLAPTGHGTNRLSLEPWAPFVTSDISLPRLRTDDEGQSSDDTSNRNTNNAADDANKDKSRASNKTDKNNAAADDDASKRAREPDSNKKTLAKDVGLDPIFPWKEESREPRQTIEFDPSMFGNLLKNLQCIPCHTKDKSEQINSKRICTKSTNTDIITVEFEIPQKGPKSVLDVSTSCSEGGCVPCKPSQPQVIKSTHKFECGSNTTDNFPSSKKLPELVQLPSKSTKTEVKKRTCQCESTVKPADNLQSSKKLSAQDCPPCKPKRSELKKQSSQRQPDSNKVGNLPSTKKLSEEECPPCKPNKIETTVKSSQYEPTSTVIDSVPISKKLPERPPCKPNKPEITIHISRYKPGLNETDNALAFKNLPEQGCSPCKPNKPVLVNQSCQYERNPDSLRPSKKLSEQHNSCAQPSDFQPEAALNIFANIREELHQTIHSPNSCSCGKSKHNTTNDNTTSNDKPPITKTHLNCPHVKKPEVCTNPQPSQCTSRSTERAKTNQQSAHEVGKSCYNKEYSVRYCLREERNGVVEDIIHSKQKSFSRSNSPNKCDASTQSNPLLQLALAKHGEQRNRFKEGIKCSGISPAAQQTASKSEANKDNTECAKYFLKTQKGNFYFVCIPNEWNGIPIGNRVDGDRGDNNIEINSKTLLSDRLKQKYTKDNVTSQFWRDNTEDIATYKFHFQQKPLSSFDKGTGDIPKINDKSFNENKTFKDIDNRTERNSLGKNNSNVNSNKINKDTLTEEKKESNDIKCFSVGMNTYHNTETNMIDVLNSPTFSDLSLAVVNKRSNTNFLNQQFKQDCSNVGLQLSASVSSSLRYSSSNITLLHVVPSVKNHSNRRSLLHNDSDTNNHHESHSRRLCKQLQNVIINLANKTPKKRYLPGRKSISKKRLDIVRNKRPKKDKTPSLLIAHNSSSATHFDSKTDVTKTIQANSFMDTSMYDIRISPLANACTQSILKHSSMENLTETSEVNQDCEVIQSEDKGNRFQYESEQLPAFVNKFTQSPPVTYRNINTNYLRRSSSTNIKLRSEKEHHWRSDAKSRSECKPVITQKDNNSAQLPENAVNVFNLSTTEISDGINVIIKDALKAILRINSKRNVSNKDSAAADCNGSEAFSCSSPSASVLPEGEKFSNSNSYCTFSDCCDVHSSRTIESTGSQHRNSYNQYKPEYSLVSRDHVPPEQTIAFSANPKGIRSATAHEHNEDNLKYTNYHEQLEDNRSRQDKVCWALTRVKMRDDGSQEFEVLETSRIPPGHFLIPTADNVILLGSRPYIYAKNKQSEK